MSSEILFIYVKIAQDNQSWEMQVHICYDDGMYCYQVNGVLSHHKR